MKVEKIRQGKECWELYSVFSGDLEGKEIQKRRDIYIHIAESLCCTADTNTAL